MTDTAKPIWKRLGKRLLIIPPILIGIAVVAIMVGGKQAPEHAGAREDVTRVRVIEVAQMTIVPRALGFGLVTPGKVWEAVAEVDGKIIEFRDDLRAGTLLPKGTVVLQIDPTDYQLAVDRARADMNALDAQLAELDTREKNTRASLRIEKRSLALMAKDLKRKQELFDRKAVSQAAVDQEERNLLSSRQSVQNLENSLNLIPAERDRLRAQIAAQAVRLAEAERDLARTVVILPFDARIAEVNVEGDQVAKLGQTLVRADSVDVFEISAQVQIDKLLNLIDPTALSRVSVGGAINDVQEILGLTPTVRLRTGALRADWAGRVVRVSDQIDPQTRTVGIIVAVDDPFGAATAEAPLAAKPPLTKNMYVEIELRGRPQPDQIVIPRSAIHGGLTYILGAEDRLELREVKIAYQQGDVVIVADGLEVGDRLVVSDLIPAISGMKLAPENDKSLTSWLANEAGGTGNVQ